MYMRDRQKKSWLDYLFCWIVGGVYLYAVHRTILSATFIGIDSVTLYAIGVISIFCFFLILYNKYTVLFTMGFAAVVLTLVAFTYEDLQVQYPEIYEMFLMVTGQLSYRPHLGRMVVWIISMLLAFALVVFMLYPFNFYMLLLGGMAVFMFTWLPGFSRDERAFLIFLAAFCVILIRKTSRSVVMAFAALPLCLAVIGLVHVHMPHESDWFVAREFRQLEGERFAGVRDFFYELLNPVHFSFQSTGFAGAGGRLGGPISVNNRYVMTVYAPGRTYLAGAISNTYTGDRWLPTLREGDINTHGLSPSRFEMLETTAALIRGATHTDTVERVPTLQLGVPFEEVRRIPRQHFRVLGVHREETHTNISYQGFVPGFPYEINFNIWESFWDGFTAEPHVSWGFVDMRRDFGVVDFNRISREERDAWFARMDSLDEPFTAFILQVYENDMLLNYFEENVHTWQFPSISYWHTYFPLDEITIRQGANRMGTVFTPPRAFDLRFSEYSFDYAPYVEITADGTKQTPHFMSHGAGYHMNFLNVDTQLSFVESVLRGTNAGVYESHGALCDTIFPTFTVPEFDDGVPRGQVFYTQRGTFFFDDRPEFMLLPHSRMTVRNFISIIAYYTQDNPKNYIECPQHFMRLLNFFSANVLAEYAREVRLHFMEVPDIVPQRVHDLTHQIVAGLDNDFCRVMAIRDYLLQFPYTMTPVHVPRGVCFVDFFLFEGQEGYCTYFASAMAVMARIAGVPSRYVEGFVLPPSADPTEPVTVTNRMAHAWVEVYLEGFGWHIVEATPTYAFLMNPEISFPENGGISGTNTDLLDRIQDLMRDFEIPEANRPAFTRPQEEAPEEPDSENGYAPAHARRFAIAIIALGAFGFAAFVFTRLLQVKLSERRIKKLPQNKQLIAYFNAVTELIAHYKTAPAPEETPKAYGARYGKRFAFHSDSVFYRDLITLYYKAKYSPAEISTAEIAIMIEAYYDMLELLRGTRGGWAYMYMRHVQLIGEVRGGGDSAPEPPQVFEKA